MQDNGPLIAMIFFILLSLLFGFLAYGEFQKLEGDDPEGLEAESTRFDERLLREQEKLVELSVEIDQRRSEVLVERAALEGEVYRYEVFNRQSQDYTLGHKERRILVDEARQYIGEATNLGGQVTEVKEKTMGSVRADDNDLRERSDKQLRELREAKEKSQIRLSEDRKRHERAQVVVRKQKNYEQTGVDEYKRQLEILTQREVERATVLTESDGQVILSDPVHNTVVINRGLADGVKNGYRFEVFAIRPGERKVHKAYVEVRNAKTNLSECMIVQKLVELPRDPVSDYVAKDPEERFSPRHTNKGNTVQPLSAKPKVTIMGMNPDDPVVEGDKIQNPFYARGKTFTFYIAGDKTIDQGRQKSAVAYTWPHIERVVKFYGGKVANSVELGVNYIIAQKDPADDLEFINKSKVLGIPVIYEWELFRFLNMD